jgi:hypothetical protein
MLGSMPTSAASNLFFVPSIPIYWRWRRWTPYFLLKFQFVWLKSAKIPTPKNPWGVNSIFFIWKLVYRVEIRFSPPKKMPKSCTNLENDGENHRTTILVAHLFGISGQKRSYNACAPMRAQHGLGHPLVVGGPGGWWLPPVTTGISPW